MGSLDGLVLDRGVPPAVEEEHVIGELEIEADAAGAIAHQQNMPAALLAKLLEHGLPLWGRDSAMELPRSKLFQGLGQHFQRLHPLGKDASPAAPGRHRA